jgi:hypothetical protein
MRTTLVSRWSVAGPAAAAAVLHGLALVPAATATASKSTAIRAADADPRATLGSWGEVTKMGDLAQQVVLLPDSGKVLFYRDGAGAQVLDPVTGEITDAPLSRSDVFCAGQGILPDGRLLINGGQSHTNGYGIVDNNFFTPSTQKWSAAPSMTYRRWYPTLTPLADGKQLSTSGSQDSLTDVAPVPELYDPVANTWKLLPSANNPIPYYPFMYQLPDGRIAMIGATEQATDTQVLDPKTWTWSTVDPRVIDGGSSVQFAPGKFLKAGTSSDGNSPIRPSSAATYVIDLNQPGATWRPVAPMAFPRAFLNLTLLPDGTVLATGGETTADGVNADNAAPAAELWNPTTEKWTTLSSLRRPRFYHSVGLLLPDGRVMASGGGNDGAVPDEPNYEMFSPPYLFKGARPTVSAVPATIDYGTSFTVATPDAANIASVRLIRPAAVTHSFDSNAQTVPLSFTATASGLKVQAPSNPNLAVPGHYMLFVVNKQGVPAIAPFTRLPAPWEDKQGPNAPTGLRVTGGPATANLAWTPATDDKAVTGYRIYRSATADVAPTPANQVATSTGPSYADSGLAAGTYYYRVAAVDGAQNAGPTSNEVSLTIAGDTVRPVVALTAPANRATVSGTVKISATATDNAKVARVRFLIDGVPLGPDLTAPPYATTWSSTATANGSHTVTVEARDSSANLATTTVTVTVANSGAGGLVAAYGFNEGSGAAAADASGNKNAGTMTGGAWSSAGRFGSAVSFDGKPSWVTIPDAPSLRLTNGMTLEAWVKPSDPEHWRTVLLKETGDGMSYGMYGFANSGKPPAVYGSVSGADRSAGGAQALPTGVWSHLAGTFDGSTFRLYVNGDVVGTEEAGGSLAASSSPLRIGGNSVWGEYFAGLIDEVRVYNRALSPTEIQGDMTAAIS